MKKIIAAACLLAAPTALLAQTSWNMMTQDQLDRLSSVLAAPLELNLKAQCPDFYRENEKSRTDGPSMTMQAAAEIIQACASKIASQHEDMMCAPRAYVTSTGCGGAFQIGGGFGGDRNCTPTPIIAVETDFYYEPAESEASFAQAPLANGLSKAFSGNVDHRGRALGYEIEVGGTTCSHR